MNTFCESSWTPLNARKSEKDQALEKLIQDSKDPLIERARNRPPRQESNPLTNYTKVIRGKVNLMENSS